LLLSYRNLCIWIRESRWLEIDVELDLSVLGIAHESGVAVLQKGKKVGIAGPHAHRHAADFNGEAETFDFGDGLGQWTARISNFLHWLQLDQPVNPDHEPGHELETANHGSHGTCKCSQLLGRPDGLPASPDQRDFAQEFGLVQRAVFPAHGIAARDDPQVSVLATNRPMCE